VLGGPLDEDVRVRGAVPQRVSAGDVQVDEGIGHRRSPPDGRRTAGADREGAGGRRRC